MGGERGPGPPSHRGRKRPAALVLCLGWDWLGVSSLSHLKPGGALEDLGLGLESVSPKALPGSAAKAWSPGPEAQGQLAGKALPRSTWFSTEVGQRMPYGPFVLVERAATHSVLCPGTPDTGHLILRLTPALRHELLLSPFTEEELRPRE